MKGLSGLLLVLGVYLFSERADGQNPYSTVRNIPLPANYKRTVQEEGAFGQWLRNVPLKSDKTVYLYNGQKKINQSAQFAVLNISVGNKDLQQCADAVIRLRAEYLYSIKAYAQIAFHATDGTVMDYESWIKGYRFIPVQGKLVKRLIATPSDKRESFLQYLETVFSYAGTLSLSRELQPVLLKDIQPGDVFIRGGSPGHAVIVMDVAVNDAGKKVFLLAQSYMPAQDIHLLKNPSSSRLGPWYSTEFEDELLTPEWVFKRDQLARFK